MGSSKRGRMNAGGSARQEKRADVKLMMSRTAPPISPGSDVKAPNRRAMQKADTRDAPRAEKKVASRRLPKESLVPSKLVRLGHAIITTSSMNIGGMASSHN